MQVTLRWSILTPNSRIFASIHEFGPAGTFVGNATMTMQNIASSNGYAVMVVKVEHDRDVRVEVDLLVINP
jgi:hypothetical protein